MGISQLSSGQLYLIIFSYYGAGSLFLMYLGLVIAAFRTKQMHFTMKLLCIVPVIHLFVWSCFLNGQPFKQFWKLQFWNLVGLVLYFFCLYNPAPWVTRDIALLFGRGHIASTVARWFPWTIFFIAISPSSHYIGADYKTASKVY
jgi:hypothetical protein